MSKRKNEIASNDPSPVNIADAVKAWRSGEHQTSKGIAMATVALAALIEVGTEIEWTYRDQEQNTLATGKFDLREWSHQQPKNEKGNRWSAAERAITNATMAQVFGTEPFPMDDTSPETKKLGGWSSADYQNARRAYRNAVYLCDKAKMLGMPVHSIASYSAHFGTLMVRRDLVTDADKINASNGEKADDSVALNSVKSKRTLKALAAKATAHLNPDGPKQATRKGKTDFSTALALVSAKVSSVAKAAAATPGAAFDLTKAEMTALEVLLNTFEAIRDARAAEGESSKDRKVAA